VDLHVVFYEKGSWGAQAFSGEKEWWFPCHPNNKTTVKLLCDVEVVMGFTCIMPMLEVVHEVIKFAQSSNTFVCDFVEAMNICCVCLYSLYCDLKKRNIDL